jgi:hypothetical protein
MGGGEKIPVTLKVKPENVWLAKRELGPQAVWNMGKDRVSITVSNPDSFIRWAAAHCDQVRVEKPEEMTRQVESRLQQVLKLYKP